MRHVSCILLLEWSTTSQRLWVYRISVPYAQKDPRFLFEKRRGQPWEFCSLVSTIDRAHAWLGNFVARNIAKPLFRSPNLTERSQDVYYINGVKNILLLFCLQPYHIICNTIKHKGNNFLYLMIYICLEKLALSLEMLAPPLSPEMSPIHSFCSQITALIAISDLATGLREP